MPFISLGQQTGLDKFDKASLAKLSGGIGLPDIQRYYWAIHLAQVMDWNVHAKYKGWVILENLITNSNLRHAPWISRNKVSPQALAHPLVSAILHAFDRACAIHLVSDKLCSITPLRGNPEFPPGLSGAFVRAEWPYEEMLAKQFFRRGRFMRQSELAEISKAGTFTFWYYMQLKYFRCTG